MESEDIIALENVQIILPLDIFRTLINETTIKLQQATEWTVKQNYLFNTEVKLSTFIEDNSVTLGFDRLHLHSKDEHLTCHFTHNSYISGTVETDLSGTRPLLLDKNGEQTCIDVVTSDKCTQTESDTTEASPGTNTKCHDTIHAGNAPLKRKRGRPRLFKTDKTSTVLANETQSLQQLDTNNCHNNHGKDATPGSVKEEIFVRKDLQGLQKSSEDKETCKKPQRYGLRGVKLNQNLMNAVKGLEKVSTEEGGKINIEQRRSDENHAEISELNDEVDPEFSEKSEGTDSDYESPKVKKVKTKSEPLKESVIQASSDGLTEQVMKRRKNKRGVVACKICNKLLCDYTGVYTHVRRKHSRHKNIKEYLDELDKLKIVRCEVCGVEVLDSLKLRVHMEIKHGDTTATQCFQCGKSFKNSLSLKSHIRAMHILVQRKCNLCHLCSASFKTLSNLNQHISLVHVKKQEYVCKICHKRFGNKPQLKRHSRGHGLDESKRVYCSFCNKSFLYEFNLRRHVNGVHAQRSEKFHCSYCGKGFRHKPGMVTHVQGVHFNLFPYSCAECSMSFPRSAMLKTHMISYHGKLDFTLPELPSKNGIYDRTTDNMFYCSYCSTGFKHKAKLVEHMHTDHATAFPHMCTLCNQGFLEKAFLDIHNLRVHDIVDFHEDENTQMTTVCGSGEILQFITTKEGCPSKIIAIQSEVEQNPNLLAHENMESVVAQPLEDGTLLVEVAEGSTTTQYMVQAPDGVVNNSAVVQDISNILLAAGKSLQTEMNSSGVQEISLVIQTPTEENVEFTEVTEDVTEEMIEASTSNKMDIVVHDDFVTLMNE